MEPKYGVIVQELREQMASGQFSAGSRVPSENQLALRYRVSRPTAARALRELEVAGLLERRVGSGTYVRDTASASPATRGRTFGLLVQGLGATEVLDPICTEITRICQQQDSVVLWGGTTTPSDALEEAQRLSKYYIDRKVDGVFFAPLESIDNRQAENVRIANTMKAAGIHVVLLDRDLLDFPQRSEYDLVGVDNFQAGLQMGEHLARAGRRRPCFLARPHHPSTTDLRAAGCQVGLRRMGVETSLAWQESGDPRDDTFVQGLLERQSPDVVVCSNDLTAALLIQTLGRLGVVVPDEVAVGGFDDVRYSTLLSVTLTTMRQPCEGIARAAVRAMRDRLGNPDLDATQLLLSAELVIRMSCGSVPESGAAAHLSMADV